MGKVLLKWKGYHDYFIMAGSVEGVKLTAINTSRHDKVGSLGIFPFNYNCFNYSSTNMQHTNHRAYTLWINIYYNNLQKLKMMEIVRDYINYSYIVPSVTLTLCYCAGNSLKRSLIGHLRCTNLQEKWVLVFFYKEGWILNTCTISILRNQSQCKYIFMSPKTFSVLQGWITYCCRDDLKLVLKIIIMWWYIPYHWLCGKL